MSKTMSSHGEAEGGGSGRASIPMGVHSAENPQAALIEDYRAGDQIGTFCGPVVGDGFINPVSEWRKFSNENFSPGQSRWGGPENHLLNGPDLSTMIEGGNGEAAFDEFGQAKYQNRRTMTTGDPAVNNSLKDIKRMADEINLPKTIVDRSNNLFQMAYHAETLKRHSKTGMASASLYIACRQEGVPRTFREICAVSKVSRKKIGRCFKLILKALDTSVDLITTGDFMSRFCCNLGLPISVQKASTEIARAAVDYDIVPGRSPISVAAAAIYMASRASEVKRSQKDIEDVTGVDGNTILQFYKLMYPRASELFPKDFKFHSPIKQLPLASGSSRRPLVEIQKQSLPTANKTRKARQFPLCVNRMMFCFSKPCPPNN